MKNCLIVDDSKVVRSFVKKIVSSLNFEYDEAADGLEALEKCSEKLPDFILLDWNMPNMDGLTFMKELLKKEGGNSPIIIFCTTESELDKITAAVEAGANEYIMKPFDAEILKGKLIQLGIIKQ